MRVDAFEGSRLALVPPAWRGRVQREYAGRLAGLDEIKAGRGLRTRAEQKINAWLDDVSGIFRRAVIPLQASDADVSEKATEYAGRAMEHARRVVGGVSEIRAALSVWLGNLGINPPGPHIKDRPALSRMTCPLWWRRALRSSQAREIERGGIALGYVSQRAEVYATDAAVRRREQQKRRNAEMMAGTEAINMDTGDIYTLAELADRAVSNPRIRRGELMTRIAGFEAVARGLGHVCDFVTVTCPSRFHAMKKTPSGVAKNRKFDGSTPRDAQAYLSRLWARCRAALARAGVPVYGFRIAEPHHDATPHWHLLIFMESAALKVWRAMVRRYALQDSPDEAGADSQRVKFVAIDPNKGSAAGYVAKYVAKNIEGGGYQVQGDIETGAAIHPGARVDAWASTWGIRQFQQIGGPPVGVWRELRRMAASDDKPDALNAAIAAADCGRNGKDENGTAGNWRRYVELMGGPVVARKNQRFGVARTRAGERWDRVNQVPYPAPQTRYGDDAQPVPYGVVCRVSGRAWESMRYRWQVKRKQGGRDAGETEAGFGVGVACGNGGGVGFGAGDCGGDGVGGLGDEHGVDVGAGLRGLRETVLGAARVAGEKVPGVPGGFGFGHGAAGAARTCVNNCTGARNDGGRKSESGGGNGSGGIEPPTFYGSARSEKGHPGDGGRARRAGA